MSNLPINWQRVKLADIASTASGGTPSRTNSQFYGGDIPWVKSGELNDGIVREFNETITEIGMRNSSAKLFRKGTLCIALYGATVGKLGILGLDASTNQAVCGISPSKYTVTEYLFYYLRNIRKKLIDSAKGGAQPNISQDIVRNISLPLAPLPEQQRIVAKLEELFSDLDAATSALERVHANLKRYRASVLKSAVEGKLTAEWRALRLRSREAPNPPGESGVQLLERILKERRGKWEETQLAKFKAQGKTPAKDWQKKYPEPVRPDTTKLPELPDGWVWASLDQISDITGGVTKGHKYKAGQKLVEVPYLRVANVQRGYLDLDEIKTISVTPEDVKERTLQVGDILFNEGGDRDKLGRGWVWEGQIDSCIHQNHVFRARLITSDMQPRIVSHHGNTFGKLWFMRAGTQSVNLASINMTVLRSFPVPIAPKEEQTAIITEIDTMVSIVDGDLKIVEKRLASAKIMRQAILKEAFEGKLVPQDPNDEPASELLKRIRAEQDARPPKDKPTKTNQKTTGKRAVKRKSKP